MGGKQRAGHAIGMGLAWLVGVAVQLHERALMPLGLYQAMVLGAVLALAVGWRWQRVRWLWVAAALAAGLGASGWRATVRLADTLPASVEGQDVQLVGVVASLPQRSAAGLRFRFDVESAAHQGQAVQMPAKVSLGWYVGWHEDGGLSEPQLSLRAGQRWRFTVRLRQPHGNLNPHGFDYELYLFEQGIRATGYVRAGDRAAPELLDASAGRWVDRLRQRVRDGIDANVSEPRAAGVLAALAVGDQSAIEREDWQLFRNTGVAHLMSISGLHVTMFAWLAGLAVAAVWRRSSRAVHLWPAPWAGRVGGLLAATAYAVFAGWGVPAQRTVWMLAVVTLLQLSGRRWPWAMVLLSAAVVVSALDPWALLQPGFWLSFVAVGLLMASEPAQRARDDAPAQRWWQRLWSATRGGVRTQLVATLGLTPLSLVFFQQVSLVGLLANLVAIPLVTLVITPLALLGVVLAPLWRLGAFVQETLSHGLAWLGAVPGAVWLVPAAPLWAQAAGLAGAALIVLPLPWRMRLLALPMVMPLLLPVPARPEAGRYEVLAVDVGQGTAVLVRTENHLLVYDAGPQYSRESDAGQRVLLPLLHARGETRIDRLVLSHRDLDHVGGAKPLLQNLPVGELLSSLEDDHPIRALAKQPVRCVAGQRWAWDGVQFDVLHPRAEDYERALKSNAMSCVLKVSGPQGTLLLTGDIERQQEAELLATSAKALRSDVLLVPHHGSRTSSTAAFLDAVSPRIAIVQAGYRNRFGHPVAEVVDRLKARNTRIETSPACGAWQWRGGDAAVCERDQARRYWHHHARRE
ncbi:DNA internalization-related competence protein ComEC/Rec2 [Piscinibacter sp. HJYY11]|uniref:DNA internalization-related competence protein ComEC/Rec2 n=1 Tax=Piscinibacter sp. HJYY11 TaxID=2801333 RepID=UPI00191E7159|nr:DNA internalization-related competence protein ComEC/Rec2 [Piscinibacter sp. HJYY11]MBL0727108.1 DNA internalization-related competence protein ComEC/Rec2 [Piscinibacter sp. HJYY11]